MLQFPRQSSRPLTARSYQAAAVRIRELADLIERHAQPATPQTRRILTQSIHGLAHAARTLSRRHRQISVAEELK